MLVQDLLKRLKEFEEQEKELKKQKKALIKQAKKERVLEVNLIDLAYELYKTAKPQLCELYFNEIYVPDYINQDMTRAIEYIRSNNMGFGFGIILDKTTKFRFTMPIAEVKLKNGEDLINNLCFLGATRLSASMDIQKLVMLNLNLDDKNMEKQFFKEAFLKCVANKEKENQQNL